MIRSQLNIDAADFHSDLSRISKALKEFFSTLFISCRGYDIENIINELLNTIDTLIEVEKFFKELFFNVYQLATQSYPELNCINIVLTIDTLDMFLPEFLIKKLNKTTAEFLLEYDEIKKRSFQECFSRIKLLIVLFRECKTKSLKLFEIDEWAKKSMISINILKEIENILKVLIKLCDIKYYQLFLYEFACFLWDIFCEFNYLNKIRQISLDCISRIFPKLVQFLLLSVDDQVSTEPGKFVLFIFQKLKSDLINCQFSENEVESILNIIEHHDRFIGQYVDGIPENYYKNGLVISRPSFALSLETDEFYEDYDNFLSNRDN